MLLNGDFVEFNFSAQNFYFAPGIHLTLVMAIGRCETRNPFLDGIVFHFGE